MTRSKRPNGESSVYFGVDGRWHGRVTVGRRDDGSADRRHVKRKTEAEARRAVRELERQRDNGTTPAAGVRWTVETWLEHWLENIAAPSVRRSSYNAYRIAVRKHLIPNLGRQRLDRLQPDHLERLYRKMIDAGARPATAHQVHRTMRTALGEAVRRRQLAQNAAALARPPRVEQEDIEPYTIEEVRLILQAAAEGRNAARWAVALALGLRQGEVLGLHWPDIDLDADIIRIRTNRLRPEYEHGCKVPCGKKAGWCPERVQVTPDDGPPKSKAGRRRVGLPPALVELLASHREEQDRERSIAGSLWVETDRVFTNELGEASQAEQRLPRLEGTVEASRRQRRPTPRRSAHRRHRAAGPRRSGAHRDGHHGLVQHRHGSPLPARQRSDPTLRRQARRRPDLGLR